MWTLISSNTAAAPGSTEFRLPGEGTVHVVLGVNNTHAGVVRTLPAPGLFHELSRIVVGPFGVKLEAVTDPVFILPGQVHRSAPSIARFELQPQSSGRSEAIFLRHGDVLSFPRSASHLTCQWTDSEVQVNSSAAADITNIVVTSADETEDEEEDPKEPTINALLVNRKRSQPRATPQLSNQRSTTIVQETPTAARVENIPESHGANVRLPDFTSNVDEQVNDSPTSPRDLKPEQERETLSTPTSELQDKGQSMMALNARTSSPRVQIPSRSTKKRRLPLADEAEASKFSIEALAGPSKRAKTSDSDTEDSRLSNVEVTKPQVSVPPRSQRNSQRSASTSTTTEDYHGPTPRIACSNSTITKASQAVKFLKKQGGAYVENLTDEFNVLCVRDGYLQKTTKVLYAIARGIPIVTDQWLYESASAKRLLATSAFKPAIPKQEEEWNLKLDDILGKPRTPFADYTVHFTKGLKTKYASFPEIEAVCKAAGAKSVTTGATKIKKPGSTIVLADDGDDIEAQKLMKDGVMCYTKDFFTYSILRGVVNLDTDEFTIEGVVAAAETPPKEQKKKRGRKSA